MQRRCFRNEAARACWCSRRNLRAGKREVTGEIFPGKRSSMRKSNGWRLSARNDGKTLPSYFRAKASAATLRSNTSRRQNCPRRGVGFHWYTKAGIDLSPNAASELELNEELKMK